MRTSESLHLRHLRDYSDGQDPGSLLTETLRTNTTEAKQRVINPEIKEQSTVGRRDGLHRGTPRSRYSRDSFQWGLKGEVESFYYVHIRKGTESDHRPQDAVSVCGCGVRIISILSSIKTPTVILHS